MVFPWFPPFPSGGKETPVCQSDARRRRRRHSRPHLGPRVRNHGEADRVIVEAHPRDLLERAQRGRQFFFCATAGIIRHGPKGKNGSLLLRRRRRAAGKRSL